MKLGGTLTPRAVVGLALAIGLGVTGCTLTRPGAPAPVELRGAGRGPTPAGAIGSSPGGPDASYVVQRGDTLYALARRFDVPVRPIIDANNLQPPYGLLAGQRLTIPQPRTHVVEAGDTVYSISRRYGVDMSVIVRTNNLEQPYGLHTGQRLILPASVSGPGPQVASAAPLAAIAPTGSAPVQPVLDAAITPVPPPATRSVEVASLAAPPSPTSAPPIATTVAPPAGSSAGLPSSAPPPGAPLPLAAAPVSPPPDPAAAAGRSTAAAAATSQPASAPEARPAPPPPTQSSSAAPNPSAVAPEPVAQAPSPAAAPQQVPQPSAPAQVAAVPAPPPASVEPADNATPVEPAAAATPLPPIGPPPPRAGRTFQWPLRGRVVATFGEQGQGLHNDGLNIAAPRGTPVHAAENGVVAYAGNEIRGFGNLLLIRHADGYMTAYAHADALLVHRGDTVHRGQVIARVGSTGNVTEPQLHFEVRQGSQPVDPQRYLGSPTT